MANQKPRALKVIQGTLQPCRDKPQAEFATVAEVPSAPDWLPNAHAMKEWERLAPLLHKAGLLTDAGLSAFGMLCSLHGKIVQLFAAGECPTGHMLAQWRSITNDFGLTPVAQGKVKPLGQEKPKNKFSDNGKRSS